MHDLSDKAKQAIRSLVDDIVAGNYAVIAADGRIGRLTEEELRRAVLEYGRALVSLPEDPALHVYPWGEDPGRFAVDVDLCTREEGRSDLTLSLLVFEHDDSVRVTIEDLHVL